MPRAYFQPPARDQSDITGPLIANLQAALAVPVIDGVFGPQTAARLKAFQAAHAIAATAIVDSATWRALQRSPAPDLFGRCLQLTAAFEGTFYAGVVGNFDGAGLTWGILGFTLQSGQLAQILREVLATAPAAVAAAFGPNLAALRMAIAPQTPWSQRLAFAEAISDPADKSRLLSPWNAAFSALGALPQARQCQLDHAKTVYWARARQDFAALDLTDEPDAALMFDAAVQNGGLTREQILALRQYRATNPGLSGPAFRQRIAQTLADAAQSAFRSDVLARKTTIANGFGVVHGANYTLTRWGLQNAIPAGPGASPKLHPP